MKSSFTALWLVAICIILFIFQLIFPGFTELFVLNERAYVEVWRFFSSIFLHGDMAHILYNMFALALFGMMLEGLIGSRKFLLVFFATGILANVVSINFYESSLGASGAIFGIIGALIIVRPTLTVWAFGLPMPIFIAGILWAAGDIIGVFVPSNVANVAHLSGMFFGLVFGAFYRDWSYKSEKKDDIQLNEYSIREWEDEYMR